MADFVEQMKNLKRIDKRIPKVKDKVGFIGQICNIIENYKSQITTVFDKDIPKKMKNFHTLLLQSLSNLDTAVSKIEQGADRHMARFAEQVSKNLIPNLNKEITKMESLVNEKKYLTDEISM